VFQLLNRFILESMSQGSPSVKEQGSHRFHVELCSITRISY
jgi:hypothetical protein